MAKRQRDYKAEYAKRVARGKAKGAKSAREAAGHAPTKRAPVDAPSEVGRSGMRTLATNNAGKLYAAMVWADANRQRFAMRATFQTDQGPKTRKLDGRIAISAKANERKGSRPIAGGKTPVGVTVIFAPPGNPVWSGKAGAVGLDPGEFLELVEAARDDGATLAEAVWEAVGQYFDQGAE